MALPKTFTGGERLFAADLNDNFNYLESYVGQEAFRLDGEVSRLDGEVSRIDGEIANIPQTILQIVRESTTSTATVTGTTRTNTALELTITPESETSLIYLFGSVAELINSGSSDSAAHTDWLLMTPDAAGTILAEAARSKNQGTTARVIVPAAFVIVRSEATTSPITYRMVLRGGTSSTVSEVQGIQTLVAVEVAA